MKEKAGQIIKMSCYWFNRKELLQKKQKTNIIIKEAN